MKMMRMTFIVSWKLYKLILSNFYAVISNENSHHSINDSPFTQMHCNSSKRKYFGDNEQSPIHPLNDNSFYTDRDVSIQMDESQDDINCSISLNESFKRTRFIQDLT